MLVCWYKLFKMNNCCECRTLDKYMQTLKHFLVTERKPEKRCLYSNLFLYNSEQIVFTFIWKKRKKVKEQQASVYARERWKSLFTFRVCALLQKGKRGNRETRQRKCVELRSPQKKDRLNGRDITMNRSRMKGR